MKTKTWTYLITAIVCIALSVTFLTTPASSTAQDGGQAITPARVEPSVAPAPSTGAKLLYFAPAENRNIALDEGMI